MRAREVLGTVGGVVVALAVSVYVLGPMFGGSARTLWLVLAGGVLLAAVPAYLLLAREGSDSGPGSGRDEGS